MDDSIVRSQLPGMLFRVSGRWGHFKKPETNNNPLTHDFITKTALLGLMGAVLGIEREFMREKFPVWSENLLYGVSVIGTVKKESWSFTMRGVKNQNNKAPRPMEILKQPNFLIALASKNERSDESLRKFISYVEYSRACYPPVLGLHNCPAALEFVQSGDFETRHGAYKTKGFALVTDGFDVKLDDWADDFRLGFERIPTYQNNDFWNLPQHYKEVCYADEGKHITLREGNYFHFSDGSNWCMI